MTELLNEVVTGHEDTGASVEPISIRDSLVKAAAEFDTDEQKAERARDEAGRFAAKTEVKPDAKVEAKPVDAPAVATTVQPIGQPAAAIAAPVADAPKAPPGWAPEAKEAFSSLPPMVQAAIDKREQEINNGFKVLQDYKGLEEFSPLVKQAGTTHAEVMRRAVDWEKSLDSDPLSTIANVARIVQQKTGLDLDKILNPALLAHLSQQPQQRQQVQQQQPVNVEQTVEQILRKRDTENQIQSFISDPANPHAEAVIEDMAALINTGRAKTLKDAYDAACWMRPDIREQLISQTAQPQVQTPKPPSTDQARRASKSITGSSAPGPSKDASAGASSSIRDSLKQAMAAAGTRA
jgi:hypothetical protein